MSFIQDNLIICMLLFSLWPQCRQNSPCDSNWNPRSVNTPCPGFNIFVKVEVWIWIKKKKNCFGCALILRLQWLTSSLWVLRRLTCRVCESCVSSRLQTSTWMTYFLSLSPQQTSALCVCVWTAAVLVVSQADLWMWGMAAVSGEVRHVN